MLGSAFGCNPLSTAAANGKRIHVSANHEPPETSKFDLPNGNQWQQESFRVTVRLYKLEVTLLIDLDWINYEHSFVSLSLKFIPGFFICLSILAALGRVIVMSQPLFYLFYYSSES